MSVNRATITGNLTRDPELKASSTGMSILRLGVAVNERVKKADQWEDYANYIDCVIFGKRADGLSPYLHKGSKVAIDGRLRWSSWEKDGSRHSKIEIIVENIDLMSGTNKQQTTGTFKASTPQRPQQATYDDDDIPF